MTHEDGLAVKTLQLDTGTDSFTVIKCHSILQKEFWRKRTACSLTDRPADSPCDDRARWQKLCARCHDASCHVCPLSWCQRPCLSRPHSTPQPGQHSAVHTEYSHSNNMYTLQTSWDFDIDTVKNTHTQYSIFRALSEDPTGNFTINLRFKNRSRIYYYVLLAYNESIVQIVVVWYRC